MTINEFSAKYGIPYHSVYEATYKVKPNNGEIRDRDYPEEELKQELIKMAESRIEKHSRCLAQQIVIKGKLEA